MVVEVPVLAKNVFGAKVIAGLLEPVQEILRADGGLMSVNAIRVALAATGKKCSHADVADALGRLTASAVVLSQKKNPGDAHPRYIIARTS